MIVHNPILLIRDQWPEHGWRFLSSEKPEEYARETRKYIYAGVMRKETWVKYNNEGEVNEMLPVVRRIEEKRQFWK